jgi:hypothetical protein
MRLISEFGGDPTPGGMVDVPDDGLAAGMDVHVFDPHGLLTAAPKLRERFSLGRVGPEQLDPEGTAGLQGGDLVGRLSPREHLHGELMRGHHLYREHGFDLVARVHAIDHRKRGIQLLFGRKLCTSGPNEHGEATKSVLDEMAGRGAERVKRPEYMTVPISVPSVRLNDPVPIGYVHLEAEVSVTAALPSIFDRGRLLLAGSGTGSGSVGLKGLWPRRTAR